MHSEALFQSCPYCGRLTSSIAYIHGETPCMLCGHLMWFECRRHQMELSQLVGRGAIVEWDMNSGAWIVDLNGKEICPEVRSLLIRLQHVNELDLSNSDVDDGALSTLLGLSSLEILELEDAPISDASLPAIGKLPALEMLGLARTDVSNSGLASLSGLRRLWCLDLDETSIGDEGVANLLPLAGRLELLHLSKTKLSDAVIPTLIQLHVLEELWIEGTRITKRGLGELRQALPRCQIER